MSVIEENGTQHLETPVDLVRISPPNEPLSAFLVLFYYACGVFSGMQKESRKLWWSPSPRAVLFTDQLHVSRSLRKTIRRGRYRVTADTAFEQVVRACRDTRMGPDGPGSWITEEIIDVFTVLHGLGHAHSIETWEGDQLVGGLYGACVGQMFYGCSMFQKTPDASKIALVRLVEHLREWNVPLLDCQMHNPHLKRMGARLIDRVEFHGIVDTLVRGQRRVGSWTDSFT